MKVVLVGLSPIAITSLALGNVRNNTHKVSATQLANHEMSKDKNRHVSVDWGMTMSSHTT